MHVFIYLFFSWHVTGTCIFYWRVLAEWRGFILSSYIEQMEIYAFWIPFYPKLTSRYQIYSTRSNLFQLFRTLVLHQVLHGAYGRDQLPFIDMVPFVRCWIRCLNGGMVSVVCINASKYQLLYCRICDSSCTCSIILNIRDKQWLGFVCVTYWAGGWGTNIGYCIHTILFSCQFSLAARSGDNQMNLSLTGTSPIRGTISVRHNSLKEYEG